MFLVTFDGCPQTGATVAIHCDSTVFISNIVVSPLYSTYVFVYAVISGSETELQSMLGWMKESS